MKNNWLNQRTRCLRLAVMVAVLLVGIGAQATQAVAAASPLETVLTADKVVRKDKGTEEMVSADKVAPGDILQYRINQKNVGRTDLNGITAIGPIPKGTRYVGGSARTDVAADFQVSIDQGKTWSKEPVKTIGKDANGKTVTTIAPPETYTHVRWTVDKSLPPKGKWAFFYRVQANPL